MTGAAWFALKRAALLFYHAMLVPPLIVVASEAFMFWRDATDPVSAWFEPLAIYVPDHCAGDDPVISYSRIIHRPFEGEFHARFEVADQPAFPVFPNGSGLIPYRPRTTVMANMALSDFMGRACGLSPGRYRADVRWVLHRPWHHESSAELNSNTFVVRSCGTEGR